MDKIEQDHFRKGLAYVLDTFCKGCRMIDMTLPALTNMLPWRSEEWRLAYRTRLTVIFQDLAEYRKPGQSTKTDCSP